MEVDALAEPPVISDSESIDSLESKLAHMPQQRLPLNHIFTPGLYVRQIFIPAGTLLTSKVHKTEHPFVILNGEISVWTKESGVVRYQAPYTGITKAGTRRVLYAHTDCIWSTFHVTNETDLEKIEHQIIDPRDYPFEIDRDGFSKLKELCTT